jgi:23S rRNA pseudouridine1911/1915/1917 synthase
MRTTVENPIEILYEKHGLVVVNKPAGLLTIPAPDGSKDLREVLNVFLHERDASVSAPQVHPCHRLDRDTSGVCLFARGKALQKSLMQKFAHDEVVKIYLAVVNGLVGPDSGALDYPLEGRSALTRYQVMGRYSASSESGISDFSVVKCRLYTGRTNQIRLHMLQMGHPLVGDDRFGRRRDFAFPAKRTLLHAWYTKLVDFPTIGESVEFIAPIPCDFSYALTVSNLKDLQ